MTDLFQEIATAQMENIPSSARLVVAHPNYTHQHRLLNVLLQDGSAVYLRCEGSELSADHVLGQFDDALKHQQGDLKRAAYLVVDEADRVQPDALEALVMNLLKRGKGRILLLTRRMPLFIYEREEIRAQTAFVPLSETLMLPDYAHQDSAAELLEVRALGAGRVMLNGRSVDNWDGTLPRALFFYLVDRGMTTRSQIFETFWPNLPTREATNVFHVTKRKISEVLGVDLTVYWSGFYRIAPNINLQYDTALFNQMVQDSAVAAPDEASRLLTCAVLLYQGEYLSSIDMEWAEKRRQEMTQNYGEALIGLGKLKEQAGMAEEALGLYLRASATNPQREDLARSIMLLYRQLGMHEDAITTYRRLETELERSLGVSPARSLQELLAEIQSEAERVA